MHEGQEQKANCSISADQSEAQSGEKSAEYQVEVIFMTRVIESTNLLAFFSFFFL